MRLAPIIVVTAFIAGLSACQHSEQPLRGELDVASDVFKLDGIRLLETVVAEPGKILIPYQKYQLENGLTIILHRDDSDPLVHVDVTYHVGSAREELGKSGFAHFFEHMMFQGSENVADEQHFKLVTEAGGSMNGTTNSDRTNYYQTVPANQLGKVLWLEADRMGFLLDAVTQEKFEVQRQTVKNERGQRIDNQPYGRLSERVAEALYPHGHPYSWPVIGYLEDLDRVGLNDLKAFFLRWYGPNNATLTIGGDIDPKQTLQLVRRYFAAIPRGPEVSAPDKLSVEVDRDRYISMEDNVHLPLVYMAYPTVSLRHEDEAPLDVLAQILGQGKTSLLYKNLIKNQLAVDAGVSHPCAELSCSFNFYALPHPASGASLADLEQVMRETLGEFEERGVEPDDLLIVKAQIESGSVFGLQSVAGKVSELAANQTYSGNPNYIGRDIARYNSVTEDDVMRVFKQYIKGRHGVIMSVVPEGQLDQVAAEDNFTPAARSAGDGVTPSDDDLAARLAVDDFDRSATPASEVSKAVQVPRLWRNRTENGIDVLGTCSSETPTTTLALKIPAGHYYSHPDKAGTVALMAAMLNESTQQRSGEQMSKALQKLGSSISIRQGARYLSVNVSTLTKNLHQTLVLLNEKLRQPAWIESEFARVKNNAIESAINGRKDAGYLAGSAWRQLMFGDNIASTASAGDEQSLANVELDDLKAHYRRQVKPFDGQLIVVSDLAQKQVVESLSVFTDWTGRGESLELILPQPDTEMGVVYLVDKKDAAQSVVWIGKRSMSEDITGEYFRSSLMNFSLGGAFNSRINLNLREDKGYTYGARSGFYGGKLSGEYRASAEVRADVTDKSIVELISEIKRYAQDGIDDAELGFMRSAIIQRDALKYETPRAKLGFLGRILEHDLTPDFVRQQTDIVANISKPEIDALANKHLDVEQMLILVVGDAATLKPQLQALDYKIIDYEL